MRKKEEEEEEKPEKEEEKIYATPRVLNYAAACAENGKIRGRASNTNCRINSTRSDEGSCNCARFVALFVYGDRQIRRELMVPVVPNEWRREPAREKEQIGT